jgi:CRISPR type III-B/RAMP module RAMP protein Cmr1
LVPLNHDDGSPIIWTDELLFQYFGLTEEEQAIILAIEERPKEAKVNDSSRSISSIDSVRKELKISEIELNREKLESSRGRDGYTKEQLIELARKYKQKINTKMTKTQLVEILLTLFSST